MNRGGGPWGVFMCTYLPPRGRTSASLIAVRWASDLWQTMDGRILAPLGTKERNEADCGTAAQPRVNDRPYEVLLA